MSAELSLDDSIENEQLPPNPASNEYFPSSVHHSADNPEPSGDEVRQKANPDQLRFPLKHFLTLILLPVHGLMAAEATVETFPMAGTGDVADDPAIWLHPTMPSKSVVLGTNKSSQAAANGLYAWDLDGSPATGATTWVAGTNWTGNSNQRYNNVDLRQGFPAGQESWDIVVASNRSSRTLDVFRIETDASNDFSGLEPVGSFSIGSGFAPGTDAPYGLALYHSRSLDRYYVISSDKSGNVGQWLLSYDSNGSAGNWITGNRVTLFDATVGSTEVEGIVADDDHDSIYIAGEDEGIYRYPAIDGVIDPDNRVLVEAADTASGTLGNLAADVEGLSLYYTDSIRGYLIASSQGADVPTHVNANTFAVYDREFEEGQPNTHRGNFSADGAPGIDSVTKTDGIDVISADLGGDFSRGLLVVHDGAGQSPSNFKLVPWRSVSEDLGLAFTRIRVSADGNRLLLEFEGTLQIRDTLNASSGWTTIEPQPASPWEYDMNGTQVFFRSID